MVDTWCDRAWNAAHPDKKEDRLMMEGMSHRQGNINVTGYQQNLVCNGTVIFNYLFES
jgi:hypothetical protein